MGDLKAIGSEKLTGQDKIKRIMEIARYVKLLKIVSYIPVQILLLKELRMVTFTLLYMKKMVIM